MIKNKIKKAKTKPDTIKSVLESKNPPHIIFGSKLKDAYESNDTEYIKKFNTSSSHKYSYMYGDKLLTEALTKTFDLNNMKKGLEIIKEYGSDMDQALISSNGDSALILATLHSPISMLKMLLNNMMKSTKIDNKNGNQRSALCLGLASYTSLYNNREYIFEKIKLLVEYGANVNEGFEVKDKTLNVPFLNDCIMKGYKDLVFLFLSQNNVNVNVKTIPYDQTPLHSVLLSSKLNNVDKKEIVKIILQKSPINSKALVNSINMTQLELAASLKQKSILDEQTYLQINEYYNATKCHICNKICKNRCKRCKNTYYCSKSCQAKDWKTHKYKCYCKKCGIVRRCNCKKL